MSREGCACPGQVLPEVTGCESKKGAFRYQTGLSGPGSRPLLASYTQVGGLLLLCTSHLFWWVNLYVHPQKLERVPPVAEHSAWHGSIACKRLLVLWQLTSYRLDQVGLSLQVGCGCGRILM